MASSLFGVGFSFQFRLGSNSLGHVRNEIVVHMPHLGSKHLTRLLKEGQVHQLLLAIHDRLRLSDGRGGCNAITRTQKFAVDFDRPSHDLGQAIFDPPDVGLGVAGLVCSIVLAREANCQ